MIFWLLGRQEWLPHNVRSKMGLPQAVAPPYLTVLPTRKRQGCCEEESIKDFMGLPKETSQARTGHECSSSHWWFKCCESQETFPQLSNIQPNLHEFVDLLKCICQLEWQHQDDSSEDLATLMKCKPSHWQTQLDLLFEGKQASDSPPWQYAHGLPVWNKLWRGFSYSNYSMIKGNLIVLLL